MVEIHDVCAMDANEPPGIESLFEPAQRKVQRVVRACGMGGHVVTVGFEPRNLRDQQRDEAVSRPDEQSADRPAGQRARQPLERAEAGLFTAEPGRDAFDAKHVIVMERRPIRSGAQVLRFVTDRRPTHAGIDPYNYYIDRNSGDNVQPTADPE